MTVIESCVMICLSLASGLGRRWRYPSLALRMVSFDLVRMPGTMGSWAEATAVVRSTKDSTNENLDTVRLHDYRSIWTIGNAFWSAPTPASVTAVPVRSND